MLQMKKQFVSKRILAPNDVNIKFQLTELLDDGVLDCKVECAIHFDFRLFAKFEDIFCLHKIFMSID